MKTEIEILGLQRKKGVGDDGKPYDYYKVHFAYSSSYVEGSAVACANVNTDIVFDKNLCVGSRIDAIVIFVKNSCRLYLV